MLHLYSEITHFMKLIIFFRLFSNKLYYILVEYTFFYLFMNENITIFKKLNYNMLYFNLFLINHTYIIFYK